jgi:hypothetical protein
MYKYWRKAHSRESHKSVSLQFDREVMNVKFCISETITSRESPWRIMLLEWNKHEYRNCVLGDVY